MSFNSARNNLQFKAATECMVHFQICIVSNTQFDFSRRYSGLHNTPADFMNRFPLFSPLAPLEPCPLINMSFIWHGPALCHHTYDNLKNNIDFEITYAQVPTSIVMGYVRDSAITEGVGFLGFKSYPGSIPFRFQGGF